MTERRAFAALLAVAIALYLAAELTLDRSTRPGVTVLRWATDPNPARTVQSALFAQGNPGLDVEVDPGLGGDQTKLIVQCATGTGPDIIDTDLGGMQTLVRAGILLDLTPYARRMGFGPDRTYPALAEALVVDGKQYAFPDNVWANAIVYNKRVFDDHGVAYPRADWTYDDFIAAGKKIRFTKGKSGVTHLAIANWYSLWFVQDLLAGCGARYFSADGLHCRLGEPAGVEAMQRFHDLMHVQRVLPSAAELASLSAQGGWGSFGLTTFFEERAAMISIGRWMLVQIGNYPKLGGVLGAVPLPRAGGRVSRGMGGTRCAGINAKGRHALEATAFLAYLASAPYNALIARDGDSLPPNPHVAHSGRDLVNARVADPAFHQVFIGAMQRARPVDYSPYVDPNLVTRWLDERVGKVENKLLTPADAMTGLVAEVDAEIARNLARRPDLKRRADRGQPIR
jgi:multiple sugar transport system substrate-binding protein